MRLPGSCLKGRYEATGIEGFEFGTQINIMVNFVNRYFFSMVLYWELYGSNCTDGKFAMVPIATTTKYVILARAS